MLLFQKTSIIYLPFTGGFPGVQRVRPVLQGARADQADRAEEGQHTDPEKETNKEQTPPVL